MRDNLNERKNGNEEQSQISALLFVWMWFILLFRQEGTGVLLPDEWITIQGSRKGSTPELPEDFYSLNSYFIDNLGLDPSMTTGYV